MAVTELALLRLLAGTEASSPSLLANLAKAKNVMEQASRFKFHYYHCVEDPRVIYVIGTWPSVEFHMEQFIPGQPNQEMLALLKDQVSVEWMFHSAIDQTIQPLPLGKEMVAIGRHFVKDGDKAAFEATFARNKHELESFIGGADQVVGGFRLDTGFDPSLQGERKEEFVLFTGWGSVEEHFAFARTEGFERYQQIRNHLDGADIKHAVPLGNPLK
ncbi:uncharacterized protein Z518_08090 [Rhinocladiella mackenziei CBS 650.93]|uniref:ABM domain-containing protein n=1 Tax=Rhinocladiella mackenziei CBS 650.93 TaxID=1442369 RepID=A0A0D2IFV8_9EURO|nr:uncharacterized protein Z518_08090 [Rhinocladiella mackenziei CBS 650.93]KIX02151.1 hypothetical protein Z518_08090 [Rhinocladiella mackenziei CBS 650.93]